MFNLQPRLSLTLSIAVFLFMESYRYLKIENKNKFCLINSELYFISNFFNVAVSYGESF